MFSNLKFVCIFSLSSIVINCALAQDTDSLSCPDLKLENNTLTIRYRFPEKINGRYRVWIELKDSNGNPFEAHSVSGDFGRNIKAGSDKTISWDYLNDSYIADGPLSLRVLAEKTSKDFSTANLMISSSLWPGLGQSKISGKPFWLIGLAGYSCLGGSLLFNRKAVSSYALYIHSDIREESRKFFSDSEKFDKTSKILAYSAVGIWGLNIVWMILNNDDRIQNRDNKLKFGIQSLPDTQGNNFALLMSINISK